MVVKKIALAFTLFCVIMVFIVTLMAQPLLHPTMRVDYSHYIKDQSCASVAEEAVAASSSLKSARNETTYMYPPKTRHDQGFVGVTTASHSEDKLHQARIFEKLHTCLDALNLTNYFQSEGYLEFARQNVAAVLNDMHLLVPKHFNTTKHNNCWFSNSFVTVKPDHLSGYIDKHSFYEQTSNIYSYTLRNILQRKNLNSCNSLQFTCLPEVFLAGFAKCGSTFLYKVLQSHPYIGRSVAKEPHFWDIPEPFSKGFNTFSAYIALYMLNFSLFSKSRLPQVDGTPQTVYSWPDFPNQPKGVNICLLPTVIPAVLPKSRFIVVMRNPVTALYSFFWFSCTRRHGEVPEELLRSGPDVFHDRVVKKIYTFNLCKQNSSDAQCLLDIKYMAHDARMEGASRRSCGEARLDVVLYYVHIQKWLSVLPRERLYFMTLEELSDSTRATMKGVWRFLGVNSKHFHWHTSTGPRNQQDTVDYHHDTHLAMRDDTRILIERFMQPFNLKLANLLGDDKYLWR